MTPVARDSQPADRKPWRTPVLHKEQLEAHAMPAQCGPPSNPGYYFNKNPDVGCC